MLPMLVAHLLSVRLLTYVTPLAPVIVKEMKPLFPPPAYMFTMPPFHVHVAELVLLGLELERLRVPQLPEKTGLDELMMVLVDVMVPAGGTVVL